MIFVALWIVFQLLILLGSVWVSLFGLFEREGYIRIIQSAATGELTLEFWIQILIEAIVTIVVLILNTRLLIFFVRRKTRFVSHYMKFVIAVFFISILPIISGAILFGVAPDRQSFTGLLVSLGIWQYLSKSSRAKSIFVN
jgi:hypothetical protein